MQWVDSMNSFPNLVGVFQGTRFVNLISSGNKETVNTYSEDEYWVHPDGTVTTEVSNCKVGRGTSTGDLEVEIQGVKILDVEQNGDAVVLTWDKTGLDVVDYGYNETVVGTTSETAGSVDMTGETGEIEFFIKHKNIGDKVWLEI